jgi:hypothetical protein
VFARSNAASPIEKQIERCSNEAYTRLFTDQQMFWLPKSSSKEASMFNFQNTPISQAMKAQLDSQISFFAQFSDKMFESMQKINELNTQLAVIMVDESLTRAQQMFASSDQPGKELNGPVEKIRNYQQRMQNVFVETQASIAKVVETHVPETVRACEAVVREMTQKASEDAAKVTQRQKEALHEMAAPVAAAAERGKEAKSQPVH